ncbi:MAG: hypothetical protein M1840_009005 [Geoglossum simile]|nr:MAG: hypothetical protein M1840_009005 [Geoglossum simile]
MNIATCRARVRRLSSDELYSLTSCSDVGIVVRQQWVKEVILAFKSPSDTDIIRAWDFVLHLDGAVETRPTAPTGHDFVYPVSFRAPPSLLDEPDQAARVKRLEKFALGSLIYEILSGSKPFSGLSDSEVAGQFSDEKAPDGIFTIDFWPIIYRCWGYEAPENWGALVASRGRRPGDPDSDAGGFFQAAGDHPVRTALQVVGGLSILTAVIALPVLGAVGFTAAGPVAGTAAAAWQASIGLVEAGSFFAWCQSAAMGGAAVQGIIATGVAGAGVAGGATFAERARRLFHRE